MSKITFFITLLLAFSAFSQNSSSSAEKKQGSYTYWNIEYHDPEEVFSDSSFGDVVMFGISYALNQGISQGLVADTNWNISYVDGLSIAEDRENKGMYTDAYGVEVNSYDEQDKVNGTIKLNLGVFRANETGLRAVRIYEYSYPFSVAGIGKITVDWQVNDNTIEYLRDHYDEEHGEDGDHTEEEEEALNFETNEEHEAIAVEVGGENGPSGNEEEEDLNYGNEEEEEMAIADESGPMDQDDSGAEQNAKKRGLEEKKQGGFLRSNVNEDEEKIQ